MKSGRPWSLSDVDEETRDALLKAAQQSGLSIDEWLGRTAAADEPAPAAADLVQATDYEDHDTDGSVALADALARLTECLGDMDEKARDSVSGLKGRLAEIERHLGRVAETRQVGRERAQSLKHIAAMIEALVHELGNADEQARSMVEGLRHGAGVARTSDARINRVADVSRDVDRRIATMGSSAASPPAASDRPPKLDDIRHRLDDLLAEAPRPVKGPPSRGAAIETALRALEARIDEAKARLATAHQPQPTGQPASVADQVQRIEARLNEISGRLPPKKDADLAAAIREISAHQRTIDDRAETLAMRRDQKAMSATLAALGADIVSLTEQVTAMGRGGGEDQAALFDLARRIDALAAGQPLDRSLLGEIRGELDAIRASVEDNSRQSAIGDLEASYREIAGRLDEFLRRAPDRGRLDALGEEVSALRRALEADDSPRAVERLERGFAELARGFEAAVSARHVAAVGPNVERLEGRLDEIASGVRGLIDRLPSQTTSPTVQGLERRLAEMAANINGLISRPAEAAPGPDVGRLESRLDDIAASINGLFVSSPSGAVGPTFGEIESRLKTIVAAINDNADRVPLAAEISRLHERLQGLAERIDGLSIPHTNLEEDLDEIKIEVASIRAVHQRLQTLTERIDQLSTSQQQPLLAIAEIKDGISAIRSIHDRLLTLTDRIDRLSAAQRDPVPAVDQMKTSIATMRAVHERLQALTDRIDGLAVAREPGVALGEMKSGIAAIEAVHERLKMLAERIDTMAVERQPALALDEIKTEITAIRGELAERQAPSTEHLEDQIRGLAGRLESVARPASEDLAELEAQVAQIAGELEIAKPRLAALWQVEERIERLQTHLTDSRKESLEAARVEAREAVRELSAMVAGGTADADVIDALARDLSGARAAAGASDQRARAKLEAVNQTLAQVVARLSRLESEAGAQSARATGTHGAERFIPGAGPSEPAWTTALRSNEAELDLSSDDHKAADDGHPVTTSAKIEPSDMDERASRGRADFIAAARRAAQAAAAEAAAAEAEDAEKGTAQRLPGAFSRISQAIRGRRRPLLLAAAAIVAAVGAIQIYGARHDDGVIATALPEDIDTAPIYLDMVAQATAMPTVPQVTAPALVAPSSTPDRDIAFAAPGPGSHFGGAPVAPGPDYFDAGRQDVGEDLPQPPPVMLASASDEQSPKASLWPPPDQRIGSPKLIAAATSGNPTAAFEIALRYAEGNGVAKDLAKAVEWYERAAEGGIAVAQYRLASLYERGTGVTKDLTKAVNWYQRAADQGNVNAMHNLAVLMSEGVDASPDQAKALEWFLAAANYGVRDSQYNLGVIYARGLGPQQDLVESYKWFAVAAARGDNDAATRRDEVAEALSPDDLAKARAEAEDWRVKPSLAEANGVKAPEGGWDAPSDTLGAADRQALVKKIQTLLAEQGFDPGPADGLAGPKTRQAVLAFQRKLGTAETGTIDSSLIAALAESVL